MKVAFGVFGGVRLLDQSVVSLLCGLISEVVLKVLCRLLVPSEAEETYRTARLVHHLPLIRAVEQCSEC